MEVRELRNGDQAQWDQYVRGSEISTPYHLSGWKDVLKDVLGSETHYLLAEDNNRIVGVLPLLHIKSVLTGHHFTSLPGGLCAESEPIAEALLEQGVELVRTTKAKYLILRDGRKKWDLPGLVTDEQHITFMLELDSDLESIKSDFKKRTRQLVNKAMRSGLGSAIGMENLAEFYPIYAQAMKELGTPSLGFAFFESMADHFPDESNLLTVYFDSRIVGGGFMAPFKDTIYCTWAGMLREFYPLHSVHLLYWNTIAYAFNNGYQRVDMGRCRKNSGTYTFKKDFGAKCKQLYQQFYLNGTSTPPSVGAEMKEDPSYRTFVNIWRRLPLQMTEYLGPKLRKRVPFG
jgi:serine/alanine adding enzyme